MGRYETIPRWIMQGYMTMAHEAVEDLKDVVPTHVFLQAASELWQGPLRAFWPAIMERTCPGFLLSSPKRRAACIKRLRPMMASSTL